VGALRLGAILVLAAVPGRAAARAPGAREPTFATAVTAAAVIIAAHGMVLSLYVEPIYTLVVSLLLGLAMAAGIAARAPLVPWRTSSPSH
jgi:hypothetical protein